MSKILGPDCTDCQSLESLDRRHFVRLLGGSAVGAVALGSVVAPAVKADTAKTAVKGEKKDTPAEAMIKELYSELTPEQKKEAVLPWDHMQQGNRMPTRLGMYNRSIGTPIGKVYTKPQQELVERIVKAMSSGEEGFKQISRNGGWDGSSNFQNVGAHIFGDPTQGKFSFMISGHHLTIRCDGNSEEGAAFGGPMYYGHSPNGYADRNLFYYQTKAVMEVYDALSEGQRKLAVIDKDPGEQIGSVQFRKPAEKKPGLSYGEMSKDQQELVEEVMRIIVSPFRKEEADEVMDIVKANGGMQKLHLGFFKEGGEQWKYWRIEGPGFVWNFRVLPHVHTFVNISSKIS